MKARVLVVAKAPVAGKAKTRLAADIGDVAAADLAAAALLDTLDACRAAFGNACHLALAGDLAEASRGREIRRALGRWHVFEQKGRTLGERLAHAHGVVADGNKAPVVQVGMDTPQVTPAMLLDATERLGPGLGVIGPAVDGGWWLLGLPGGGAAGVLGAVPMSTRRTGFDTRRALAGWGVRLASAPVLRDVDTVADAQIVAGEAPDTRFAAAWARVDAEVAS